MLTCQSCNRQFENITKLASHLSHPKSSCKCNIKEYYNTYLRKDKEGICIYCGSETAFASLTKGYPNNKCKHCRNEGEETKKLRRKGYKEKIEKKKIERGYYDLPIVCELCNDRFKEKAGLAKHISQKHTETLQDYYNKYFKKDNEGICPITGKKTNFKSISEGYYKYSGKGSCSADPKIKEKKTKTLFKNYYVINPVLVNKEKRIKNFKNTLKKKRMLMQKRKALLIILRKLTIDKMNKLQCQICGKIFNNIKGIVTHVIRKHETKLVFYYNSYFKRDNEGICLASNKETRFFSLEKGYLKYKENYHSHPDIVEKIKSGLKKNLRKKILKNCYKYNIQVVNILEVENISSLIHIKCLKCNKIYKNRIYNVQLGYGKCPKCYPRNTNKSKGENEVYEFLKEKLSQNITIIQSYNGLIKNSFGNSLEVDMYIPEKNTAIEFNGLYWHSENILSDPIKYHLDKTNKCKNAGVKLIHIFEDEWYEKKEIIKKMLLHKLGESNAPKIYARNCYIKEIDAKIKNSFLILNHIQGKDHSKIKLGLFTKKSDYLISVMTFSGKNLSRGTINIKDTDWELSRFATDMNYQVIGSGGKLLEYFKNNFNWTSIFSYADLRYSEGALYYKLGFKKISQSPPNYWYVNHEGNRFHRFGLRKTSNEPKDIPEWKLRHKQGFYRIWDCGNLKFLIENNKKKETLD